MSANFWQSSHFTRWTFSKDEIARYRESNFKRRRFPIEKEIALLNHYILLIQSVGKRIDCNQIVVATATSFFRRFYLLTSILEYHPSIVAPTVLYLAAKVEEMGQILPIYVIRGFQKIREDPQKMSDFELIISLEAMTAKEIFACEAEVLKTLKFDLVIFHAYHDLERYVTDFAKDAKDISEKIFHAAWGILNDTQRSDVYLVYPPCLVALAAIYLACVDKGIDSRSWFQELNVNLDQTRECAEDILKAADMDDQRVPEIREIIEDFVRIFPPQPQQHR